jgi:peroxiredoxin
VKALRVAGRRKWRIAAVVLLVVVYLVLHWGASLLKQPAMVLPTPQERTPFAVDFALPDMQGNLVRLSALRGQAVLINIWATWCYPCRAEMPSMNALYHDYRARGFTIVAIATDAEGKAVVAPFIEMYGLTFPVVLDPQNVVGAQLRVPGIPASYVLDKRGRIVGLEIGARDWNTRQVRRLLEHLLDEDSGGTTP